MKSFSPILSSFFIITVPVNSFSASSSPGSGGGGFLKLDRFSPSCPADESCIRQFDPKLLEDLGDDTNAMWVAVYRSNNNKPSVFVRDEFFSAMTDATTSSSTTSSSKDDDSSNQSQPDQVDSSKISTPMALEKPVAVARLAPSEDFDNKWVLDSMRCLLKKEDQDESCDGGSEFVEALSVCVDSLLMYHLQENTNNDVAFEGSIRTKATLYSNKILEERGFRPVEELSKDMASHISQFDACLDSYAQRTASLNLNPGARDRALQMVSLLGKLDEDLEREAKNDSGSASSSADDQDDYDPWANIKMQI